MMEQAHTGKGHGHPVAVGAGDDEVVADGAARLGNILHAALLGALDIIAEREERVGAERHTAHRGEVGFLLVNGPGEMADADYGYVGEGRGHVTLYRGKTPVLRSVPQEEAIDRLLELIAEDKR